MGLEKVATWVHQRDWLRGDGIESIETKATIFQHVHRRKSIDEQCKDILKQEVMQIVTRLMQ